MARRDVSELEPVEEGEVLVRLVATRGFDGARPQGQRVKTAALQTNDFTPSETSYGASVYVVSRLDGNDVRAVLDKSLHLEARVPVSKLTALGIRVVYSPEDCEVDVLKPAHASLLGVTHANRPAVLRLIDEALGPKPDHPG